ncbi:hypothetical protein JMJ55_16225 [Belnapia sp. T6]|uniref:Uncharacterized protein n=1 Tax=Belnapia mucosa TaxID=2804532 RepID=A0ABS1V5B0_9PROT|nr:hypothetical protein [Belnapia mucosa]MBL6456885.1 hypothetical protein [Belnapia mucosa]
MLAGCAEMRQAPPPAAPLDLVQSRADPSRAAIDAAAAAFADRGAGLTDRPGEAARAAAQLEYAVAALGRETRYAPVPDGIRRDMLLARTELRDALGVAEDAPPEPVIRGLLGAARALQAGRPAQAAAALPAPLFRPGGERSVARLGNLGPLPQAANATALAAREVARLDAESGWNGSRPGETGGTQITTFGLGGNMGVGY